MNKNIKDYIDHAFSSSDCQSVELTAFAKNIHKLSLCNPIKFEDWWGLYFEPTWNECTGSPSPQSRRGNYCRGAMRQINEELKRAALLAPPYPKNMWIFNPHYFNDKTINYILEKANQKTYRKTRAKLLEDRADELAKKTKGLLGNIFSGELQAQDGGVDGMTIVMGQRVPYQSKNLSLDVETFKEYYNNYKSRGYPGGAFFISKITKDLIDYLGKIAADSNYFTVLKCEFILPKKDSINYIIEWIY